LQATAAQLKRALWKVDPLIPLTLIATYLPAHRAARIDPAVALRAD